METSQPCPWFIIKLIDDRSSETRAKPRMHSAREQRGWSRDRYSRIAVWKKNPTLLFLSRRRFYKSSCVFSHRRSNESKTADEAAFRDYSATENDASLAGVSPTSRNHAAKDTYRWPTSLNRSLELMHRWKLAWWRYAIYNSELLRKFSVKYNVVRSRAPQI